MKHSPMKKKLIYFSLIALLTNVGCRKIQVDGGTDNLNPGTPSENVILEGRITENKLLKANYTYKLRGLVYVTNGAILTIEPGTKIVGRNCRKTHRIHV